MPSKGRKRTVDLPDLGSVAGSDLITAWRSGIGLGKFTATALSAYLSPLLAALSPWTDVATASSINLASAPATATNIRLTGTTTVTALTGLSNGERRFFRAGGNFTLQHGASLDCPGGNSIAVVAGDRFTIVGLASGVIVESYQRGDGTALISGVSGEIKDFAFNRVPSGWLETDGAAYNRSTYPALFAALVRQATVTITIASPGVITWIAHGLRAGDPVKFTTTGALPTGITAGTTYYVISTGLTADTFRIATTAGGSAINTSGSQSGTHTGINAPWGDGNGSTTFNVPNFQGEFRRSNDNGRGVDTNRVFGSAQAQDIQSHSHTTGGDNLSVTGGGQSVRYGGPGALATSSTGGSETRPRNVSVLTCVKI